MINLLKNIFLVLEILSKAYFTTYERFLDKTYSIILKNFDIEFMGNYIYYHDNYHKSMDEIRRVYLEIYENYNHSPSEKNDYPPENNGNIIVSKLNKEFSIKEEVKENKNIKEVSLISHNDNLQSQEKINERLVNNLEATDKNSKLNDKNYEKIYNSDKDEKEKPKIIQEFDSSKIQDKKEVLKRDNGTAKTIIKMEKILCQMAPNNYSFNFLENFSIDCFYEDNNQKPSEFEQHSNIFEYMILFYFGKNKLNEEKIKAIEQKLKKISLEDFKKCLNINAKILENRKMILNNYFSKKIKKITDVYQTEKYLGENEKLLIELYEILEKEKPENIIKYLERFWYQLDQ